MKLTLIVVQYKQSYANELRPNVVDVWDEFVLDDNFAGFEAALAKHDAMRGTDYERDGVKTLEIEIPDESFDKLFDIPLLKSRNVREVKPRG